jgi:cobalt-zinc-cadmium efflux system membrane fusion protein
LKAPITGVIVASHVTPGEFIKPEKLLFQIVDSSRVWVEADVYEMDLALVEDANRAVILSEAYPNERFVGNLVFVGQKLDPASRTVKTVFEVENRGTRLRDGMFVSVSIETKTRETGPMFPKSAVVKEGGQDVVYVKTAPETFIARSVEIKGVWGNQVMTASGVKAGDLVVVQGMYQVRTSGNRDDRN